MLFGAIICIFFFLLYFLFSVKKDKQYFLRFFSKKEFFLLKSYLNKNTIESSFFYTLKNLKFNAEDFKDIISFYNKNKDELDSFKIFFIIKRKLIKQFKTSKLSDIELKNSIEYFLNNLNIFCPIEQRRQLNEIDAIISNKDNKLNNIRKKIIF